MNKPRPGYGKLFCVSWLAVTGEIMYSDAMTKEAAKLLVRHGKWHERAEPSLVRLRGVGKRTRRRSPEE